MRQSAPGAVIIQFCGGIHEIYFPYILARPALILAPVAGSAAGLLFFSLAGAGLVAPASPGSIISVLAMAPKGQTLVVLAGVLISTAVSLLMAAPFVRRAATAEDMPTGAIPATQGGAPAVKAAQYFPAHIRKVVFACDAGMGSSALGATRFRKGSPMRASAWWSATVPRTAFPPMPTSLSASPCWPGGSPERDMALRWS